MVPRHSSPLAIEVNTESFQYPLPHLRFGFLQHLDVVQKRLGRNGEVSVELVRVLQSLELGGLLFSFDAVLVVRAGEGHDRGEVVFALWMGAE